MNEYLNPYYSAEKLGLEMTALDEPGMCYEYNTLCFWATNDGRVFTAQDSGCSCPTPFEDYSGRTQDEVLQKLERVGSPEQAEAIINGWNNKFLSKADVDDAVAWVKAHLKSS